jgi:hypothetical protein
LTIDSVKLEKKKNENGNCGWQGNSIVNIYVSIFLRIVIRII